MKQKNIIITFLFCFSVQLGSSQVLPRLTDQFNRSKQYFEEKMFVHVNKPNYLAGETLWFKAYNTSNETKILTDISKVAYVEILTESYEAKAQIMVELINGVGSGYMLVPENLATGSYIFRAYTNLMKNAGSRAFFEQKLSIVNVKNQQTDLVGSPVKHQITFAAEGGTLVEGISNEVAIKVTEASGKGLLVNGAIVSHKNDTIAEVRTSSLGFSKFQINPKPGEQYKFVGTTLAKDILINTLPLAQKRGYSLRLIEHDANINVDVFTNTEETVFYAIVVQSDRIVHSSEHKFAAGKATLVFTKDKLVSGLLQLSIFNSKGEPVAERMFCQQLLKQTPFDLDIPGRIYLPRQKVEVLLANLSGANGKDQVADLSMSVFKINQLPNHGEVDGFNYMHFTSELKNGLVSSNTELLANSNFNDLLIAEQSRKFNWNESWDRKLKFLPEYNGNIISGTVLQAGDKPSALSPVYLTSVAKPSIFYHTKTDSLGNFKFNAGKLSGIHELIIQTNYTIDSSSVITVNSPYDETKGYSSNSANTLLGNIDKKAFEDAYFVQQVDEFYSPKPAPAKLPAQDTVMFYGAPEKRYILADYTKFDALEDVLREYVSEVTVTKRQKGFNFRLIGGKEFFDENPLVLYDGIPYFDLNKMMAVSPDDIYSLEIVRDKYYYNGETYSGIMHFRSHKANISDYDLKRNAVVIDYDGLQLPKAFPEIRYDSEEDKRSSIPNYRSAVYWNPKILVGAKSHALNFFTPDLPGKYKIVLQGLNSNGSAIYRTLEIEVQDDLGRR